MIKQNKLTKVEKLTIHLEAYKNHRLLWLIEFRSGFGLTMKFLIGTDHNIITLVVLVDGCRSLIVAAAAFLELLRDIPDNIYLPIN